MVDNQENEQRAVAFNMSGLQIEEVFRLLQKANNYYLNNDYTQMVHTLIAVKLSVIQSLGDKERSLLKSLEVDMMPLIKRDNFFRNWNNYNIERTEETRSLYKYYSKIIGDLKDKAENYKIQLMDILEQYGYLIKKLEEYKEMF